MQRRGSSVQQMLRKAFPGGNPAMGDEGRLKQLTGQCTAGRVQQGQGLGPNLRGEQARVLECRRLGGEGWVQETLSEGVGRGRGRL